MMLLGSMLCLEAQRSHAWRPLHLSLFEPKKKWLCACRVFCYGSERSKTFAAPPRAAKSSSSSAVGASRASQRHRSYELQQALYGFLDRTGKPDRLCSVSKPQAFCLVELLAATHPLNMLVSRMAKICLKPLRSLERF